MKTENTETLELTAEIVSAYVANNPVPAAELGALIGSVHGALQGLSSGGAEEVEVLTPAVPIKKSVTPDYLICLEDGKKYKTLKRTLATAYGMTPAEYRTKWGLPTDYPMAAPNYSSMRAELAKKIGLGRTPEKKTPARRGRKAAAQ